MDGRTNPDGSPYTVTGEQLLAKLPDIVDFCRVYLGVDPMTQPMPIQPTAHYTMGGIPTNKYGEVVIDEKNTVYPRPVRGGRMRLRLGPRREPARDQLPARPGGVRQVRRAAAPRNTPTGVGFRLPARRPERVRARAVRCASATAAARRTPSTSAAK